MAVTVYKWTDASAPSLNNAAGSLIGVLDACLVNGYGSKSAAGWGKAYSGTNKAVYRAATGNRHYLRVDDTATTPARIVGYESMSDVDTGTAAFPTEGQFSGGLYAHKSESSTVRPWIVVASSKLFYVWVAHRGNAASSMDAFTNENQMWYFGEFSSYKSGDAYNTIIAGATAASYDYPEGWPGMVCRNGYLNGHYLARSYTQTGSSIAASKLSDLCYSDAAVHSGTFGATFPDPISGSIYICPMYVSQGATYERRGVLDGQWFIGHNNPLANGDTFDGSGDLAGKTFMYLRVKGYSTGYSFVALEISDTW